MSLLNVITLKFPTDDNPASTQALKALYKQYNELHEILQEVLNIPLADLDKLLLPAQRELQKLNDAIQEERSSLLSASGLLPKDAYACIRYETTQKTTQIDALTALAQTPRVEISELQQLADKLRYCIFDERVCTVKNTAPNAEAASQMSEILKIKGYKTYYVAPLSAFDFGKMIEIDNDVYAIDSYYGVHEQTFTSLLLSLNTFRDLYNQIAQLRHENTGLRKMIDDQSQRTQHLQQQFQKYAEYVQRTLKVIAEPLNTFIQERNEEFQEKFKKERRFAEENNARYPERFTTVNTKEYFVKTKSGYERFYDEPSFLDHYYYDLKTVNHSQIVDNWFPVPTHAQYFEEVYPEHFEFKDFPVAESLAEFEKIYTPANVRKLLKTELENNYLMIAVKGSISEYDDEDAIVLSTWGMGFTEESLRALGVK